MDFEDLKELINFFEKTSLQKLHWAPRNGSVVTLEKPTVTPQNLPTSTEKQIPTPPEKKLEGFIVTSPLVGIFYRSPQPGAPPYVSVGDTVDTGSVLCIVEAMKVMNEIKPGKAGYIAEIFFDDMAPVEFGSPLFRIV